MNRILSFLGLLVLCGIGLAIWALRRGVTRSQPDRGSPAHPGSDDNVISQRSFLRQTALGAALAITGWSAARGINSKLAGRLIASLGNDDAVSDRKGAPKPLPPHADGSHGDHTDHDDADRSHTDTHDDTPHSDGAINPHGDGDGHSDLANAHGDNSGPPHSDGAVHSDHSGGHADTPESGHGDIPADNIHNDAVWHESTTVHTDWC